MSLPINKDTRVRTQEQGDKAEDLFIKALKNENIEYRKASTREDMFDHIDFYAKGSKGFRGFDVKAYKGTTKEGKLLIEFRNVKGDEGWIKGKADFIAFDMGDRFMCVPREELLTLAERLCDLTDKVHRVGDALYKGYTRERWNRFDLITLIKISDVKENIKYFELFY